MNWRLATQLLIGAELLVLGAVLLAGLSIRGFSVFAHGGFWVALAISGAATGVVVSLAARRWARGFKHLQEGVTHLVQNDFEQRLRVDACDEMSQLAGALDELRAGFGDQRDAMRDEISRLLTIMQGMTEGVIAVDQQEHIMLANKACGQLLRLATPDLVGRPLLEATRCRPLYDAVQQSFARPGPMTSEFEAGDAPKRALLLRAARLPGDPCPGVVVVLHDVSEIRRLENLRKEFVANVSHELKTPLASVKAYAETLRLGAINDQENNVRFVERIELEANRLHRLIADMLQIARIESHQQAFQITRVPIASVVERCMQPMEPRAAAKNIQLLVEPSPAPIAVRADEDGLLTMLTNLLDNAIKYTPEGGRVVVRWMQTSPWIILQVEDSGIGIAVKDQGRIFERFYRVDQHRSREMGGTGLGLSIVKHLVQAFGGNVNVQSELGKGSVFELRFPVTEGN